MSDPKFDAFIARLKKVQKAKSPKALLKCVNQKSIHDMVTQLIEDEELAEQIQALKPYEAIRLEKNKKQQRTLCILKAPDGTYQCILETKSKTATNKKNKKINKFEGGSKRGKPSWRLDGENGPEPYVSLLEQIEKRTRKNQKFDVNSADIQKEVAKLKREVTFTWGLPKSEFIHRSVFGALYANKKGLQQALYSPQGIPLDELDDYNITLTDVERDTIAVQLIAAVAFLHQHGFVHQDLKAGNVLLFKDPAGKLQVKLIDFEYAAGPGYPREVNSTASYESPEIALLYSKKDPQKGADNSSYEYFQKEYRTNGDSLGKILLTKLQKQYKDRPKALERLRQTFKDPDPKNDIFALGLMLYKLYHNDNDLKTIPKDNRFAALLNSDRDKRFTAAQALALWQERTGIVLEADPISEEEFSSLDSEPSSEPSLEEVSSLDSVSSSEEPLSLDPVPSSEEEFSSLDSTPSEAPSSPGLDAIFEEVERTIPKNSESSLKPEHDASPSFLELPQLSNFTSWLGSIFTSASSPLSALQKADASMPDSPKAIKRKPSRSEAVKDEELFQNKRACLRSYGAFKAKQQPKAAALVRRGKRKIKQHSS